MVPSWPLRWPSRRSRRRWRRGGCKPDLPAFQFAQQRPHRTVELAVGVAQFLDAAHRVDHGRMIAAAELAADLWQRTGGEALGEIHRDLPRPRHHHRAPRGDELDRLEREMGRNRLLDLVDRGPAFGTAY